MNKISHSVWVRAYVLNHLETGPIRVSDLIRLGADEFGFTSKDIVEAGQHFGVAARVVDGQLYWARPANLFAIWWAKRHWLPPQAEISSQAHFRGHARPRRVAEHFCLSQNRHHSRSRENEYGFCGQITARKCRGHKQSPCDDGQQKRHGCRRA